LEGEGREGGSSVFENGVKPAHNLSFFHFQQRGSFLQMPIAALRIASRRKQLNFLLPCVAVGLLHELRPPAPGTTTTWKPPATTSSASWPSVGPQRAIPQWEVRVMARCGGKGQPFLAERVPGRRRHYCISMRYHVARHPTANLARSPVQSPEGPQGGTAPPPGPADGPAWADDGARLGRRRVPGQAPGRSWGRGRLHVP